MADPSHADDDALRRDLVEETLQECERLLAAAEAETIEIRQTATRHAQERAETTARALTAAAERLREEAAGDREAAQEERTRAQLQRQEAERLSGEADAELRSVTERKLQAEQELARLHEEVERLTSLAQARLADATALQGELEAERDANQAALDREPDHVEEERLERLDTEIATRLADADQIAAERLAAAERHVAKRLERLDAEIAARHADAERSAAERLALADAAGQRAVDLLEDAKRQATELLAQASAAAGAQLADAQRQADTLLQRAKADAGALTEAREARRADDDVAHRVTAAERAAAERLAEADSEATRRLLDALEEARRIVAGAEADASRVRSHAEQRVHPPSDDSRDTRLDLTVADDPASAASEKPTRRSRRQRGARTMWFVLAAATASVILRSYVATPYTVAAESMEPKLSDGDRVVLNRLAFEVDRPARGDVVVFNTTDVPGAAAAPGRTLVKRVIGLPGEQVQALDGELVVDGEVIEDPWQGAATPTFGPILVPDSTVFVLGDNRSLSVDSRTFGFVPIDALDGRVEAVIWPPRAVGRV